MITLSRAQTGQKPRTPCYVKLHGNRWLYEKPFQWRQSFIFEVKKKSQFAPPPPNTKAKRYTCTPFHVPYLLYAQKGLHRLAVPDILHTCKLRHREVQSLSNVFDTECQNQAFRYNDHATSFPWYCFPFSPLSFSPLFSFFLKWGISNSQSCWFSCPTPGILGLC